MNELSLYILDLVQNSVSAKAAHVEISVVISDADDSIVITIQDDGCGMSGDFLAKVTSPFTTTRKTRRVGLGLPMIKELCEQCEGGFGIESRVGEGTRLSLSFKKSHIDLPPMGSLADTMVALVSGSPAVPEFRLAYANNGEEFEFDTAQIREALAGVPLDTPDVLGWIRDFVTEGIEAAGRLP